MILCSRPIAFFGYPRGCDLKQCEVIVRRERSCPDLISHDEYSRSYSGKATTCRKRSDNVPAIERSASKPRVKMHLPASRRRGPRVDSTVSICKFSKASSITGGRRCLQASLAVGTEVPLYSVMGEQHCRRTESTYSIVSPPRNKVSPYRSPQGEDQP